MTPIEHLNHIVTWFISHATKKYMAGSEQHGGRLWRKPVWKYMRDEVIDQVVYFQVLEEQQEEVLIQLKWALKALPDDPNSAGIFITKASNLLEFGNIEGIPEEEKE